MAKELKNVNKSAGGDRMTSIPSTPRQFEKWEEDANCVVAFLGEGADGAHYEQVCEVTYPLDPSADRDELRKAEARQRLITAAPDLLAALKAIRRLDAEEVKVDAKHRDPETLAILPGHEKDLIDELGVVLLEQVKAELAADELIARAERGQ